MAKFLPDPATQYPLSKLTGEFFRDDKGEILYNNAISPYHSWDAVQDDVLYLRSENVHKIRTGIPYTFKLVNAHSPFSTLKWKYFVCPDFHPFEQVRGEDYWNINFNVIDGDALYLLQFQIVNLKLVDLLKDNFCIVEIKDGKAVLNIFSELTHTQKYIVPLIILPRT